MAKKETLEAIRENMLRWQQAEKKGIVQTARIMEQTDNRLIHLIMEIIQRDSHMHYRLQQMIWDSLEAETVSLSTDELTQIWEGIERHIATERETIDIASSSLAKLQEGQARGYLVQ